MSVEANRRDASNPAAPSGRPAQGKTAPAPSPAIDPWLLLRALGRRWLLAAVLGVVLGGLAGWAVWAYLPPGKHTVYRLLYLSAVVPDLLPGGQGGGAAFDVFKSTQIATIKSRQLLNAALRRPKVAKLAVVLKQPDALEWLERELKVTQVGPEIVQVALSGAEEDVNDLKPVVDAVTDEYLLVAVESERTRQLDRQAELRKIAAGYVERLKGIRQSMERFRALGATVDPALMAVRLQLASKDYDNAVQDLTRCRTEIRTLTTQLAQMEAGKTEGFTVSEAEVQAAVEQEPAVVQEGARLADLDRLIEAEAAKSTRGREATFLKPLVQKLKEGREALGKKKQEMAATVKARIQEDKTRSAALGLVTLRQRLSYLQSLEKVAANDCNRFHKVTTELNFSAVKLEDVKHDIDELEAMLKTINGRAERISVELAAPARVRPFDNKENAVTRPNEVMRRLTFGGVAGVAILALVCLGVAFVEMRARRLGPPAEIAEQLGLPLVGTLPYCKGTSGAQAALNLRLLKEAVDGTRTLLLQKMEGETPAKVVMIASAAPGEGKTSLGCHLATSLARAGRRTLLIDGDLRKPDVHSVFGVENGPGLCAVLRGESALADAVVPSGLPGLTLLPAGRVDDRALRGAAGEGFSALLEAAQGQYDCILIDSSPLMAVSDALILAGRVDAVLMAALQGETRLCRLGAAAERLSRAGGKVMGVVVNGTRGDDRITYHQYTRYLAGAEGAK